MIEQHDLEQLKLFPDKRGASNEVIQFPKQKRERVPSVLKPFPTLVKLSKTKGVYFLMKGSTVVYVGMTTTGMGRPFGHTDKKWDRAYFWPLPDIEETTLRKIENRLIMAYLPKCNNQKPSGAIPLGDAVKKIAELLETSSHDTVAPDVEVARRIDQQDPNRRMYDLYRVFGGLYYSMLLENGKVTLQEITEAREAWVAFFGVNPPAYIETFRPYDPNIDYAQLHERESETIEALLKHLDALLLKSMDIALRDLESPVKVLNRRSDVSTEN